MASAIFVAASSSTKFRKTNLVPVNHGAKIRIHFFSLRLERSALYNPHFCIYWQPIVDNHMAKISKQKLMLKENSFEWDSGFSDG